MQSVFIITKIVSYNPVLGDMLSIQHYVIKFVSDLRQVSGFYRVLRFHSPKKTDRQDITEILLTLKTINQTNPNLSRLVFSHSRYVYFLNLSKVSLILKNGDSGTGVMLASSKSENKNEDSKRCNES